MRSLRSFTPPSRPICAGRLSAPENTPGDQVHRPKCLMTFTSIFALRRKTCLLTTVRGKRDGASCLLVYETFFNLTYIIPICKRAEEKYTNLRNAHWQNNQNHRNPETNINKHIFSKKHTNTPLTASREDDVPNPSSFERSRHNHQGLLAKWARVEEV